LTRRQVLYLVPLVVIVPALLVVVANALTQPSSPPIEIATPGATAGGPLAQGVPIGTATVLATTATSAQTPGGTQAAIAAGTATAAPVAAAGTPAAVTGVITATPASTSAEATAEPQPNPPYVAYTVQAGDTLAKIGAKYNVPPLTIARASGLTDPNVLHQGQLLTVPKQAGTLVRVQPGESMDQIAARTGHSVQDLETVNDLQAASVKSGYVLLVPDPSPTPIDK
jgi:LysM repeat protein